MTTPENCPLTGRRCPHPKIFTVSEIIDHKREDINLCSECAHDFLMSEKTKEEIKSETNHKASGELIEAFEGEQPKTGTQMLHQLMELCGLKVQPKPDPVEEDKENFCPKCKTTLKQIAKEKKVGCKHCYKHFEKPLTSLLKKTQDGIKHVGKVPKKWLEEQERLAKEEERRLFNIDKYLDILTETMEDYAYLEEYNIATAYRDLIKTVEQYKIEYDKVQEDFENAVKNKEFDQAEAIKLTLKQIVDTCFENKPKLP